MFASEFLELSLQRAAFLDLFDDHEVTLFLITLCSLAGIQLVLLADGFCLSCQTIKQAAQAFVQAIRASLGFVCPAFGLTVIEFLALVASVPCSYPAACRATDQDRFAVAIFDLAE